jgi:hypothetical protein
MSSRAGTGGEETASVRGWKKEQSAQRSGFLE